MKLEYTALHTKEEYEINTYKNFGPFFHAEMDGNHFYSEEDLDTHQRKKREEYSKKRTCFQKFQIVVGMFFYYLLLLILFINQKLFGG